MVCGLRTDALHWNTLENGRFRKNLSWPALAIADRLLVSDVKYGIDT